MYSEFETLCIEWPFYIGRSTEAWIYDSVYKGSYATSLHGTHHRKNIEQGLCLVAYFMCWGMYCKTAPDFTRCFRRYLSNWAIRCQHETERYFWAKFQRPSRGSKCEVLVGVSSWRKIVLHKAVEMVWGHALPFPYIIYGMWKIGPRPHCVSPHPPLTNSDGLVCYMSPNSTN